ncbi:MAG: UvrD-helicase domain-containing protein [Treponema sp.]|jgi:DNA helicase-2/ATP-dependent DNA helicase PcrA|nr:UvrD-helicase domain-containing protein [Treponema sp.]MBQ2207886.1 UvrD-helicase domain-containing protein [Treponema sp.]MBQ2355396.1 UvrD-helicase domain-containing protein [Treponema sp.]MBQ3981612.1 UvrD-helicase domain-containing protein [Treponema sp.]MBQ5569358.1 UvrD-helicase domain-containing protein [Treponema sp.]
MSLEEDLKSELNPEQYRAVTTLEGAILIIAGAGSGKTRVITCRIANMLEHGIPQSQILALTFTNKAAKEMSDRIKGLTNKKLQNLTISTFHAFGVRVLRQDIQALGYRENFSIYDETDRYALIKETGRELHFTGDAMDVYKIGGIFSDIKTGRKNWNAENSMYRELYESYQEGLKVYNSVDFDDLITLPIKLWREHPDILEAYRNRYKYIMVDEFQDTSHQQYEMMHILADKNVAVVGDDDQSIYSWRGADYQNILNFEKDFPEVQEIRLEQNYRSTGTILAAANGVIKHNTNRKDKELWSGNGEGKPIEIYMPENEAAEADFIADGIQGICIEEKRKYDDFGVLMRANTQSRAIEEAFLEANIPYVMSGGTSFFERKEIKDIISYLRVISNHDDDINLLRIINTPRRGIGRTSIEALNTVAARLGVSLWEAIQAVLECGEDECPVSDSALESLKSFCQLIENNKTMLSGKGLSKKVKQMVTDINYFDFLIAENPKSEKAARFKYMNIESLIKSMEQWENNPQHDDTSLYAYLNRITLLSRDDLDDGEADKGKVNLMTVHASKGLEFPVVFIAGAEEGLMPHARAVEEGGDNAIEEERRLFYVAVTRARDRLFISSCRKRRKMNASVDCEPSRFLDEIPQNLVKYHEPSKEVDADAAHEMLQNMLRNMAKPHVPKL